MTSLSLEAGLPNGAVCQLQHPVFAALGDIGFHRAPADGMPVMLVPMGELAASVPLRSLQREFGIADDTADGRMLGIIAESLDYVSCLHPGDPLPAEVLTGSASWAPDEAHRARVLVRLRRQLLRWLDPAAAALPADDDPQLRARVQAAFDAAAQALGLGSRDAVMALFAQLGEELALIEALRDRLLRRVAALSRRLNRIGTRRQDGERTQMLIQVQRLAEAGRQAIQTRFDEIDAQTGDIMAVLAGGQQPFIRSNRDWLYRCQRAWDPVLADWDQAGPTLDGATWALIARTYRFLAPRYMPFQAWRAARPARPAEAGMAW